MSDTLVTQTKPFPRDAANLGFWGVILDIVGLIIGFIPVISFLGFLASLASIIVRLIAYFKLASGWKDEKVESNAIWLTISTAIAVVLTTIGTIIIIIGTGIAAKSSSMTTIDPHKMEPTLLISLFFGTGIMVILGVLVILAGIVIWAIFEYKLYSRIGEVSGISEFKTAGLLELVGALTLILAGLGLLISLAGTIFALIGWIKARETAVDVQVVD